MERLDLDLIQVKKAIKSLEKAFLVANQLAETNNPDFILAAQDSIIQRFEYCYDIFWKFLKKYLKTVHDLNDANSPYRVFHICVRLEICSLEQGNIFLNMAEARNETSHTYSIESARNILIDVPIYYAAMKELIYDINNKLN